MYRQLEAQDGLHMVDTYMEIFAPRIRASVEAKYGVSAISPMAANATKTYNAPNGGKVHYVMVGLTEVDEYYLDYEGTRTLLNMKGGQVSFWTVVQDAFGEVLAKTWQKAAAYSFTTMMIAMNSVPETAIKNCGGYASVTVTYDPTIPATYHVVLAWKTYPTIRIDTEGIRTGPTFEAG